MIELSAGDTVTGPYVRGGRLRQSLQTRAVKGLAGRGDRISHFRKGRERLRRGHLGWDGDDSPLRPYVLAREIKHCKK
ncbi:MAG: hypothetical protein CM1200mP41_21800 [Gammaproteobacteria bacterium]|nr:MAG: hypothetical protein CM1200mP41_21800 [Gammaproteobacteria bacterium]